MTIPSHRTGPAVLLALIAAFGGCATAQGSRPEVTTSDASAARKRAYEAERAGDHEAAAAAFGELIEIEAGNPDWVLRRADNLGKAGRYNDAMDLLSEARGRFPDVPPLLAALAKTYHLKADSMVAEGVFDMNVALYYGDVKRLTSRLLELNPEHLEARLLRASAHYHLREYDEALADAQRAVADHPKQYGAQAMLGRVASEQFIALKRAEQSEPASGAAQRERAAATEQALETAQRALAAAAAAESARSYPRVRLGDLDAWQGSMDDALVHYGEALALDPAAKLDHGWLRGALEAARRVTFYENALSAYGARPDSTAAQAAILQWYAAQAHYDARAWEPALARFTTALTGRPDFVTTDYYRMQAAYWKGDEKASARFALGFAQAEPRKFADMIRDDAQTTAILRGMAQKSFEAGRLDECREINHVLAFATNTPAEWNNYALLCRDTKRYGESLEAYEHALTLEQSPQLLNDAAVIMQYHLATPANLETARNYYERAIERAQAMLDEDDLDAATKDRTRTALRDAKTNLSRLKR